MGWDNKSLLKEDSINFTNEDDKFELNYQSQAHLSRSSFESQFFSIREGFFLLFTPHLSKDPCCFQPVLFSVRILHSRYNSQLGVVLPSSFVRTSGSCWSCLKFDTLPWNKHLRTTNADGFSLQNVIQIHSGIHAAPSPKRQPASFSRHDGTIAFSFGWSYLFTSRWQRFFVNLKCLHCKLGLSTKDSTVRNLRRHPKKVVLVFDALSTCIFVV